MGNGARVSNRSIAERQRAFAEATDEKLVEIEEKIQKIIEKNHKEIKDHLDNTVAPTVNTLSDRLDALDALINKVEGRQLQDAKAIDKQRDLIDQTNKRVSRIISVLKKTPLIKWFVTSKLTL